MQIHNAVMHGCWYAWQDVAENTKKLSLIRTSSADCLPAEWRDRLPKGSSVQHNCSATTFHVQDMSNRNEISVSTENTVLGKAAPF